VPSQPVVHVVDDDPAVRRSLECLVTSDGLAVETHSSAREFLDTYNPAQPGCLVLDIRMPGMSGLDLQDELQARGITVPIVVITAYGKVSMASRAMRAGAVDFIEKPFSSQILLERIHEALDRDAKARALMDQQGRLGDRLGALTERERLVMALVVEGKPSKAIAAKLGISPKTVAIHRAHIMSKTNAESVPQLVQWALATGTGTPTI